MNLVCLTILGSDLDMTYNSDRYRNFHVRELDRGGGSQLRRISFPRFCDRSVFDDYRQATITPPYQETGICEPAKEQSRVDRVSQPGIGNGWLVEIESSRRVGLGAARGRNMRASQGTIVSWPLVSQTRLGASSLAEPARWLA